jgi:hypothetical protein
MIKMLICFQATIGSRNAGGNRQEIRQPQIFWYRDSSQATDAKVLASMHQPS